MTSVAKIANAGERFRAGGRSRSRRLGGRVTASRDPLGGWPARLEWLTWLGGSGAVASVVGGPDGGVPACAG